MRLLLILLFGIWVTHTLQYYFTATTGISNFPRLVDVGMLNGEPISMYDSTSQKKVPKQKWMAENLDYEYWNKIYTMTLVLLHVCIYLCANAWQII
uniref:MHC class I-like antigen recognition-like domain-containing protein n=1 Tax=Cyprinus carpio carpio TaxID=630221 RepID=A0A9J8DB22_CYPCA